MGDPSATAVAGDIVAELKSFIVERSLPLWSEEGWDGKTGGFVDRLDADGRADRLAARRTMVQARQIYCFAKAAQMGWYADGKTIALKGLDHLLCKAKAPDGQPGFVHKLDEDGTVLDPRRDTYDHAFVLLALATVYSLDRDAQVRSEIDAALSFVDHRLRSPHGGFAEGFPATLPRRQNPQMHLFEAMIALFDATHDFAFQQRAGEFFSLFMAHLYDKQQQALGEYFEEDWSRIEPVVVEPGHQAEWAWLLRLNASPVVRPRVREASSLPARCGIRTLRQAVLSMPETPPATSMCTYLRRLWPQTEIAKAWIAQAEFPGEGRGGRKGNALARLERHYLRHPVAGGWYDQFDRYGNSLIATIPASSFYHVLCAVTEAEQVLS
ncbi:MAG: AGE family epimerase/isomerase [Thiolinea sp.]